MRRDVPLEIISYVFLRVVDAALSVATRDARLVNPVSLAGYLAPFHMLVAGPISPYADHVAMDDTPGRPATFAEFASSLNDISTGLFYKKRAAGSPAARFLLFHRARI